VPRAESTAATTTAATGDERTDVRLLEVAERLFATHGIDAVSLRSITIEAGANIAAVHYHFGTKVDLVRALVERRVDEVNAERLHLLRGLESARRVTPRDIAEVWIRPLARLALDPRRRTYLGFVTALQSASPELRAIANAAFAPHFKRIDALLERAVPQLDVGTRRFRFSLLTTTSIRALADLREASVPWRRAGMAATDEEVVDAIIDAMTGLLAGDTPT
jgi:AcrR family transcriptional regulator